MCGRYTLAGKMVDLEKHYRAKLQGEARGNSYNIAPSQQSPVILNIFPDQIRYETWGLVPFWTKPDEKPRMLINTRADSLLTKPGFKRYLKNKRCLVPASGFYEWKNDADGKQPWLIRLASREFFSFAGIWEEYANKEGELIYTFSIITTGPNRLMREIHDRMPVILPEEHEESWLKGATDVQESSLLIPYRDEEMIAYPVSRKVNSPSNNDESLTEKIIPGTLF
jgi:putative SOS response-associated peptidase YedK